MQAKAKVAEALATAKRPTPEKSKIIGFLNDAKQLLQNVASFSGAAATIANAAAMVWRLF